mgnify:CR=1 FL=1
MLEHDPSYTPAPAPERGHRHNPAANIAARVDKLRSGGASWRAIGGALGLDPRDAIDIWARYTVSR